MFVIVNGIKLNCWCGPVTFNFLNLRECEGLDSEVACWHELGPRGVDYISQPGEKEGNLGGNLFSFFLPSLHSDFSRFKSAAVSA